MHKEKSKKKRRVLRRQRKRQREAGQQRTLRVKWLRRKGTAVPEAAALADKLDHCTQRDPCGSAGCPECSLTATALLTKAFRKFLRERQSDGTVVAMTVVLPSSVVPLGELHAFDAVYFVRRLKYLFDKTGVGWVIGAIDLSCNLHDDNRYAAHWLVHLHGFAATDDPNRLRADLVKVLPKSDTVPRPLRIQTWDGDKKAIGYALKTVAKRRVGSDLVLRFNKLTDEPRWCRATKSQRLRAAEKLELTLFLDRAGWNGRLFLRHAQQRTSKTGTTITLMRNHGG